MQNDLISRSAAKAEILSWAVCLNKPHLLSKDDTMHVLGTLPAVDAVEVVRCKDCKYYRAFKGVGAWCHRRFRSGIEYKVKLHDFCSYGKRRDDDGNDNEESTGSGKSDC